MDRDPSTGHTRQLRDGTKLENSVSSSLDSNDGNTLREMLSELGLQVGIVGIWASKFARRSDRGQIGPFWFKKKAGGPLRSHPLA